MVKLAAHIVLPRRRQNPEPVGITDNSADRSQNVCPNLASTVTERRLEDALVPADQPGPAVPAWRL
jgi:hypothetical protein